MHFCPTCGLVCVSKKDKNKTILVCRKCGYKIKDYKPIEIKEEVKKDPLDDIVIIEEKKEALPKIRLICPKCSNKEAVWWMQQTRSTDEPPTLFFRCTKCRHSWREY
jgi:DNA-directed RNA polymerase subunit M